MVSFDFGIQNEKLSCGDCHNSFLSGELNLSLAERKQEIYCQVARLHGEYILEAKLKVMLTPSMYMNCAVTIFFSVMSFNNLGSSLSTVIRSSINISVF